MGTVRAARLTTSPCPWNSNSLSVKKAIIIGHEGQDGRFLWKYLTGLGYELQGWGSRSATDARGRVLPWIDIASAEEVSAAVRKFAPEEIYHFAAFHHSSEEKFADDTVLFRRSMEINFYSILNVLQAVHDHAPACRVFYAASSRVFGSPPEEIQTENSPFQPFCAYGIAKVAGLNTCRYFRQKYGTHASVGILFNHESSLRRPHFLSKKIITSALAIRREGKGRLVLGNLLAAADWGYAPDTVRAIHRMLQLPQADDYILATGEAHTVKEFAATAFRLLGLDWTQYVEERPEILREVRRPLVGDAGKFRAATGWRPEHTFEGLVRQLLLDEGGASLLV
jgi:GDPmannose 4,6-dehydratase